MVTKKVEWWWGSDDYYWISNYEADLRVGGRWNLNVQLPDGSKLPASGQFLHLDSPHKAVFTRCDDFNHLTLDRRETVVTYKLEVVAEATRVTVRHDGFEGARSAAEEHTGGWVRFLGWFSQYLTCARRQLS